MKDGLKSAAMECGAPSMLEAGIIMMPWLSVDILDISSTQVSKFLWSHGHVIYYYAIASYSSVA